MTRQSLRFRLLLAAALSTNLALLVAGLVLIALFEHHVERRVETQLDDTLGLDRQEIRQARQARRDFAADIFPHLALLGAVLVLAAWSEVRIGLGPAIAQDICDAYGSDLAFGRADLGGLAVSLRLPPGRAPAARGGFGP